MKKIKLINNLWKLKIGIPKPIAVVLWVTEKCNLRCMSCNIWKQGTIDMDFDKFKEQLEKSKILKNINTFAISGGEPFLNKDIVKFADIISKSAKPEQIRFTSNGFATELIVEKLKEICMNNRTPINIKFSVDGLKATHDKLRGVKGSFDRIMNTVDELKKLNLPNLSISLGFTANSKNYKELGDVLDIAEHKKIGFFYKPVMKAKALKSEDISGDLFLSKEQFEYIKNQFHERLYKLYNKRNFGERFIYKNYLKFLEKYYENPKRIYPCYACSASFHIGANGNVFSCVQDNMIFGNIYETDFDKIWKNKETSKLRKNIKNSNCHCTCTGEMFPNILVNKFPLLFK